ncbi:hypothetical protein ACT3CE_09980 [Marinifilum sp. RC60d5]|uniref:hypothetical protein n=1 Tax=Marinifilum sp. RC60d5 TaxID=3458414 RepID=UPI00403565A5
MKKIGLLLGVLFMLLQACADSKPKKNETSLTPQQENTEVTDSISNKLENTIEDLEKAEEEIDKMLEDL